MSQVQFAPTVSEDIRLAQKMLIGGDWVSAMSGRTLPVYDPADGRMIVEVPDGDAADVDRAVAAARAAFAPGGPWRSMTPQERGKLIWRLADLVEQNAERLAMWFRSAADDLKRVSLELGGKSPNIVFDDADLDEVVAGAAAGAFATQGESCIAGSRLYVQRGVFDEVVRRLVDYAASIKLGRGTDPATQMGPLISAEHRDKVLGYVAIGVAEGAQVVTGGHAVAGEGYFAEPTVLVNAKPDSRIMHEEIFGPVVSAVPFDTEDEVLALANCTRFGLGAAVWTRDISRAHRMAAAIESGQVWVNCYQAADSALPFGGTKESGWGRETCRETLEEYLETKTVVVSL